MSAAPPRGSPSLSDHEKGSDRSIAQLASSNDGSEIYDGETVDEKKVIRKIDWHLLPVLCVLYLLAFLDRVNISNAALFGLQTDLNLTSLQYNNCLVIFFVPYILAEVPANVLMKKFRPHITLPTCMFMFGLVTTLQGLTFSYGSLLVTRFFLGFFEAAMFPGCFYLLAMWYRRSESQKRYSFFFCSTTLAGAFGGLLASAIGKMDGDRGYRGWRWVFILEGVATCLIALTFFFLVPDFPEEAAFLTEAERQFVKARLKADVGSSARHERLGMKQVLNVFKDYKIFLGGFMYFGLIVPAYGNAYFAPTIIKQLGYTSTQAQLHSVPPWAVAFFFAMIVAFASDHLAHRWLFSVGTALVALAGFAILLAVHDNVHVQYAAMFLITMGTYTSMPLLVCWFNTNLAGHHRRSVGSAWQVGFGNIGGIIAAYLFPAADAKTHYKKGYSVCVAFICLSILSSTLYVLGISWENRRRAQGRPLIWEMSEADKEALGDLNPDYRYLR
ncbi:MFS transporter [Punctularia strigosozonata HHB-11173 SS5]|uniref:MFS transporter n=1 Tax=Punctularia strigosozonata (strain HHB-11173) TaxID=741275 RepID=UPI0004417C77|nr:MFS transporter [Punctularia strigosozonata HHB-11173 SS5]EIN13080.1 MFS transporter [Punctularia strigosozonata HHB-11173 SS5]